MARDGTVGASSASRGVWHALSVFPDERAKVAWTGALFFVVLASASIGLNVADALFFLRFGVDSLPAMIMLSGGVVMVVTIAYAAGHSSFGARTWSWTVRANPPKPSSEIFQVSPSISISTRIQRSGCFGSWVSR